jgi:hypothetical protein
MVEDRKQATRMFPLVTQVTHVGPCVCSVLGHICTQRGMEVGKVGSV